MNRYTAREILAIDLEAIWDFPEERHVIVFDDGEELTTHTRATIQSRYFWEPIVSYPQAQLLVPMHIGDRWFNSKVMLDCVNEVIWSIEAAYPDITTEEMGRLAFEVHNRDHNDSTIRLSPYVSTLSMFDIVEVMDHPEIQAAKAEVKPTAHSIENECYPRIVNALMDRNQLVGNSIADAARSGTIKIGQLLQCIGPRGFMTGIDSTIYRYPIMSGYIEGIHDLYGSMIESRSGAKSLLYNKHLLRQTEYFNRQVQLGAQVVQRLHKREDCGTPHHIEIPVMAEILPTLKGKYRVMEDGSLVMIRGNEKDWVGEKIAIRSVFGCIHPDPGGICGVCYGKLASSIPEHTNIGQVSAIEEGDAITSSVLSIKHEEASSRVERYNLPTNERRYLRYGKEPETLYLNRKFKGHKIKMKILASEAPNLANVIWAPDLDVYPPHQVAEMTNIVLIVDPGEPTELVDMLRVSLYNRKAGPTPDLMRHIAERGWTEDERGNYEIDLTGFDVEAPFLVLPTKHVSMYEFMNRVRTFLHSGEGSSNNRLLAYIDKQARRSYKTRCLTHYRHDPVQGLLQTAILLQEKLDTNFVHCEILAYSMMARSTKAGDYRLPKPAIHGEFVEYTQLATRRSMGLAMSLGHHSRTWLTLSNFRAHPVPDHPYDAVLMGGAL